MKATRGIHIDTPEYLETSSSEGEQVICNEKKCKWDPDYNKKMRQAHKMLLVVLNQMKDKAKEKSEAKDHTKIKTSRNLPKQKSYLQMISPNLEDS